MSVWKPSRVAYREELVDIASENADVVCLEADLGGHAHPFERQFPDRFFNVGIAESAMVDIAAGLVQGGWRPFVSTFAPFAALRAAESIKLALGYQGLPIVVVAPYAGVSGGWFGTTHHCLEDIAVMRSFPGIRIASPYGEAEMRRCLRQAYDRAEPTYIRCGRNAAYGLLDHSPSEDMLDPLWLRKSESNKICFVGVGEEGTRLALETYELVAGASVVNLPYVDDIALERAAAALSRYGSIVVFEEHRGAGGVTEGLSRILKVGPVVGVHSDGSWPSTGGHHQDVLRKMGFSLEEARSVIEMVKEQSVMGTVNG